MGFVLHVIMIVLLGIFVTYQQEPVTQDVVTIQTASTQRSRSVEINYAILIA
mgnify:CR=1 FL=1